MRKVLTLLLSIIAVFVVTACESDPGTPDVTAKESPSGDLNLDITGKTFVYEHVDENYYISKDENTYNANGERTNTNSTYIYFLTEKVTITFNADGTFTLLEEQTFAPEFDVQYSYSPSQSTTSNTTTTYDMSSSVRNTLNRTWGLHTEDTQYGDAQAYSGYSGQLYRKRTITGTWEKNELESDGFEDTTTEYRTTITSDEMIVNSFANPLPAAYAIASTQTSKNVYDEYSGDSEYNSIMEYSYKGENSDGQLLYEIDIEMDDNDMFNYDEYDDIEYVLQ
jgi:hypothetical protein